MTFSETEHGKKWMLESVDSDSMLINHHHGGQRINKLSNGNSLFCRPCSLSSVKLNWIRW